MPQLRTAAMPPLRARGCELTLDLSESRCRALDARGDLREALAQTSSLILGRASHRREQSLGVAGELGGDDPLARHASQIPGEAESLERTNQPLARVPRRSGDA